MGTYRNVKLIEDLAEPLHLPLHLFSALVPEALLVCLLKSNGRCLLQRRHTAVADAGVSTGNVLDQVLGSDQVADAPAGGVEGFACGADGERPLIVLWLHGGNSGKWDIVETVVDLVGEDDEVVLHGKVTDAFEFIARENLPNRIMTSSLAPNVDCRKWRLTGN
jgi:hypothetical protein